MVIIVEVANMDIQSRIEQLKAQIAEKEAYQKKLQESYSNPYKNHKYTSIWDYVVEGNRAGFDKEDAEAAAYQKLLMEQAQADKLQKEQMLNAQEIARQNKSTQDRYNEIKLKQSQATAYNAYVYAKQAKDMADKEGNMMKIALANKNLSDAKAGLQMLGINPDDYETNQSGDNKPTTGVDAGTRLANIKGKKSFNTKQEKADYIESIKQDPMYGQDGGHLESEVQRLEGINTKEEIDAYKKEAQDSYDRNVTKDSKGQPKPGSLAKWKEAYPKYAKALGYK
jgi:hypothetical protein